MAMKTNSSSPVHHYTLTLSKSAFTSHVLSLHLSWNCVSGNLRGRTSGFAVSTGLFLLPSLFQRASLSSSRSPATRWKKIYALSCNENTTSFKLRLSFLRNKAEVNQYGLETHWISYPDRFCSWTSPVCQAINKLAIIIRLSMHFSITKYFPIDFITDIRDSYFSEKNRALPKELTN